MLPNVSVTKTVYVPISQSCENKYVKGFTQNSALGKAPVPGGTSYGFGELSKTSAESGPQTNCIAALMYVITVVLPPVIAA